jgi:2-amino-4-hydroxy-6-hydroxymethyldihydropteridine diphosphokinase
MREPVTAFVGVGANLGDAAASVRRAIDRLSRVRGTTLAACSSLYRSRPVDAQGPDFVNAVAQLCTTCTAPELLAHLQQLEAAAGRERPYRNAPRTLDLDLLLYGDARIESAQLTVPHPRMHQRAFVLLPLAQIAPQRVTPSQLAAITSQVIARMTDGPDDGAIATGGSP